MLLPWTERLVESHRFDRELARLADRHYSRGKVGAPQFMGNGKTLVLRDTAGNVVFGWLWSEFRMDNERGYNCAIFRNESDAKASALILEAEHAAVEKWGPNRAFTYIDPRKVKPTMFRGYPVWGWCFYKAGWSFSRLAPDGKHILEKSLRDALRTSGRTNPT